MISPTHVRAWLKLWVPFTRPRTLVVSIFPVLGVGMFVFYETGNLAWQEGCLFVVTVLCLQVACNLTNDYYDFLRGSDRSIDRVGPQRALLRGEVSLRGVRLVMLGFYLLAELLLLGLAFWVAPILFLLAQPAVWVAYSYTGGKFPLAYRGFGEFAAWFFFGPVIVGVGSWILLGGNAASPLVWQTLGVPIMILACSYGSFSYLLISLNNLRDRVADELSGKQTLAVRWGHEKIIASLYGSEGILILGTLSLVWSEAGWGFALPAFAMVGGVMDVKTLRSLPPDPKAWQSLFKRACLRLILYTALIGIVLLGRSVIAA